MRTAILTFVLVLVLAINGLHSPALAHDHGDHHAASLTDHDDLLAADASDSHPPSDDDRNADVMHDHQPPAGLNVSDLEVGPDTGLVRNLLNPAPVATLTSRVADPPTEPPTA